MKGGRHDFEAVQGAAWNETLTWRDENGALVDLTGYTAVMEIFDCWGKSPARVTLTSADGDITLGGEAGTIKIEIDRDTMADLPAEANPGDEIGEPPSTEYVYRLTLTAGTADYPLLYGTFTVFKG